ncbi:MAG: hypothetical protein U9O56_08645, partial [Campylobacterota bacterium]|nr:hypothetical protein [Campylobacterota bacterium]
LVPTVDDVNELRNQGDEYILEFVQIFREIMRTKNIVDGFADFKWSDLKMGEQEFENYKSKYLDIYEENKELISGKGQNKEKVSILEDVDFELELIHKDEIDVSYILKLLGEIKDEKDEEKVKKQKENIVNILNNNPQLRSKRELIEQFINENLLHIKNSEDIDEEFEKFWDTQKEKAYEKLCEEENLDCKKVRYVVDKYIYEQRVPLKDDIAKTLKGNFTYLKKRKIIPRVLDKIVGFVDKFYEGTNYHINNENKTNIANSSNYEPQKEDELLVASKKVAYGKSEE